MYYIDLNYKQEDTGNTGGIALMPGESKEADPARPQLYHVAGISPEQLLKTSAKELERDFIRQLNNPKPIALGPAGIDPQLNVNMGLQWEVFEMQALLAAEMQLPLLLQARQPLPELLALHETLCHRSAWIIQDFRGNASVASIWTQQGVYLSVGSVLFTSGSVAVESLSHLPVDQLFLETGLADASIVDVYQKAAKILALDSVKLQENLYHNFMRVFDIEISKPQ